MIEVVEIDGWICPAHDTYFGRRQGIQAHTQAAKAALEAAEPHLKRRRLALDVGAHIGLWTRYLVDTFEQVVAFEPAAENFAILCVNNENATNLRAYPLALGPKTTRVTLQDIGSPEHATACHYVVEGNCVLEEPWTLAITLDVLRLPYLDLLKIDVEGLEIEVIHGGRATIDRCRPVIVFEDGLVAGRYGHQRGDMKRMLEKGYDYREVARVQFMSEIDGPPQYDVVMAPCS